MFKKYLIAGFFPFLLLSDNSALMGNASLYTPKPLIEAFKPQEIDSTGILDPLNLWLEKLSWCESRGNENANIVDSNGLMSRGILQFQDKTWKSAIRKYGLFKETEDLELINLVWDKHAQFEVAKAILENEKEGFRHWTNCSRIIGIPPNENL